ncbi:MAG: ankyrin repeat domain-containing protein [Candidatus Eremiobacteraeota bacterium]|nr:ankyrin repeat domain-containing protein [Candidatus Eremiobacteraeota bacterium]
MGIVSKPISKTRMHDLIAALDWKAVRAALADYPDALKYRGRKGENLLHLCCGRDLAKYGLRSADSIKTAAVLLDAGIDVNEAAFREEEWKATPLWYAIAHGKNLQLAKYLLERGSSPNYCTFAAAYNDDAPAVRLLCKAGAEDFDLPGPDTPLLFAVKWSRFTGAKALLECGANANVQDANGKTPLHYMLKKRSDPKYLRMFLKHGALLTIPDRDGITVQNLLSRVRDPRYRELIDV